MKLSTQTIATASARHRAASSSRSSSSGSERSCSARIITGAALIIVAMFAGFARDDLIMFQQMGFGVAVALLLDAIVIRSVVLPSLTKLLGEWNCRSQSAREVAQS